MSPKKASAGARNDWRDYHTQALVARLVSVSMHHRSEIYADPPLLEVNDHGSDRIRAKLEKVLGDLAIQYGLGREVVKMAKGSGGGSSGGDKTSGTKKRPVKSNVEGDGVSKKRKSMKVEV